MVKKRFHKVGCCAKCNAQKNLTRHHILPKRHFVQAKKERPLRIILCRRCHDKLELLIPWEKMPERFYSDIVMDFLRIDELRLMMLTGQREFIIELEEMEVNDYRIFQKRRLIAEA